MPGAFELRVKLFAVAKQLAGSDSVRIRLPGPATIRDVRQGIAQECPALGGIAPQMLFAVNSTYADDATPVTADCEVACIPPVSGGRREIMIRLTRDPIDHAALTEQVRSAAAGAVVTFLGTVREFTDGRQTTSLDYEAYSEMAERKMREIESEARARWPIVELGMVHRVGRLELGGVSVAIALSCPHRSQAFEACRYVIDRVKEVVPIWKCENWASGASEWVHPGLDAASARIPDGNK